MSCYLRHLKDLLNEAGIEVKAGSRKQIDETIHEIVGVAYKDCAAWKQVKKQLQDENERRVFIERLQIAVK